MDRTEIVASPHRQYVRAVRASLSQRPSTCSHTSTCHLGPPAQRPPAAAPRYPTTRQTRWGPPRRTYPYRHLPTCCRRRPITPGVCRSFPRALLRHRRRLQRRPDAASVDEGQEIDLFLLNESIYVWRK